MPDPKPSVLNGVVTVEDVMAALAKHSIFDLPTLVRQAVKTNQEHVEAEDEPGVREAFIHNHYMFYHDE